MGKEPDLRFETLLVGVSEKTATITVNRPESLNALNQAVLQDLDSCLNSLGQMNGLSALIVTGQGQKAFVAGADIAAMERMSPAEAFEFSRYGQAVFQRLSDFQAPVIAAVNGYALGGGNELAMACDIRIASENAKFGQPEVGLGIIPGFGGTQRLARIVGDSKALELIVTGRVVGASEALTIGLVNKVVPVGEALKAATELAGVIASKSGFAVRSAKEAVKAYVNSGSSSFAVEQARFSACFESPDQVEGMRAFLEKRPANFK